MWVVSCESIIKMYHRIFESVQSTKMGHDSFHTGSIHQHYQIFNETSKWLILQVWPCNLEEKNYARMGWFSEFLAVLLSGQSHWFDLQCGPKTAVVPRLGKHVGEFAQFIWLVQIGDQYLRKCLTPTFQCIRRLFLLECPYYRISDKVCKTRHSLRQHLRTGDQLRLTSESVKVR